MKKYITPELELIELTNKDIIATSLGTETTPKDDSDGIWDFNMNP